MPDEGNYSVTASNGCTSNTTHFYLQLYKCEVTKVPEPLQHHNVTVLAEPTLPNVLQLTMTFHGNPELFWSITRWAFGRDQCFESAPPPSVFNCNRTLIGSCTFTADLWIPNPTYVNSGRYVVQAITSVGLSPPNNATIDLCKYMDILCLLLFPLLQYNEHWPSLHFVLGRGSFVLSICCKE